jgi:flagellum-specific peptidoglycan hydrolase FlgJ
MNTTFSQIATLQNQKPTTKSSLENIKQQFKAHWLNAVVISAITYLAFTKDVTFHLQFSEGKSPKNESTLKASIGSMTQKEQTGKPKLVSLKTRPENVSTLTTPQAQKSNASYTNKSANTSTPEEANFYQNIDFMVNSENAHDATTKREKCWNYVSRYVNVAKQERIKFGIPVSITLAQGILESDAGQSALTRKANNHFGVKSFQKGNKNVVIMKDDTPNDKFVIYSTAWASYRAHSLLLMKNSHYQDLQFLSKTDYIGWAKGLQNDGYATDPEYAKKLIQIIKSMQLYKFDV